MAIKNSAECSTHLTWLTPFFRLSVFLYNIEAKNRNFGRKSKFWTKIKILVDNRNVGQKSKFRLKIEMLMENRQKLNSQKWKFYLLAFARPTRSWWAPSISRAVSLRENEFPAFSEYWKSRSRSPCRLYAILKKI